MKRRAWSALLFAGLIFLLVLIADSLDNKADAAGSRPKHPVVHRDDYQHTKNKVKMEKWEARLVSHFVAQHSISNALPGDNHKIVVGKCISLGMQWRCPIMVRSDVSTCTMSQQMWADDEMYYYIWHNLFCGPSSERG